MSDADPPTNPDPHPGRTLLRIIDRLLKRIERFLNSRTGNVFLIVMWPSIIAAIGVPTGAAQMVLEAWLGHPIEITATAPGTEPTSDVSGPANSPCTPCADCLPCPSCPTGAPESDVHPIRTIDPSTIED